MTSEEQIEQNAREYASVGRGAFQTYKEYAQLRDAFIAGAHSMDYEIGTLKCKVRELWENIEEQEKTIENLEDQLQKLKGGKK